MRLVSKGALQFSDLYAEDGKKEINYSLKNGVRLADETPVLIRVSLNPRLYMIDQTISPPN